MNRIDIPETLCVKFAACLFSLIAALALSVPAARAEDFPRANGYINDLVGVLDPATKDALLGKVTRLKAEKNIELGVGIINTTNGRDIAEYGVYLARAWGIGAKDGEQRGLLLLIAVKDHKSNIQVSRHLEGDFTDGKVGEILRLARDDFKRGDFNQGVTKIVDEMIAQASKVGVEDKKATTPVKGKSAGFDLLGFTVGFAFLGVLVGVALLLVGSLIWLIVRFSRSRSLRPRAAYAGSGASSPQTGFASPPESSSSSSSDSSSSSSSSSEYSSSSSSDSSSFSGGSDFGGGGASDSW